MNNELIVEKARQLLAQEKTPICLIDTETTGLDTGAEICEIAVIDSRGNPLLNTLVKPSRRIPADVVKIHGITNEMVANSPCWNQIHHQFCNIVQNRKVLIYNADYDIRLIHQTAAIYRLTKPVMQSECIMLLYAQYCGEWNTYRADWKWQKLTHAASQCGVRVQGAHRALGDCMMTLAVLKSMAGE